MSEEELEASVAKVASLPTLAGSEADVDGGLIDMSKTKSRQIIYLLRCGIMIRLLNSFE